MGFNSGLKGLKKLQEEGPDFITEKGVVATVLY
jgi:hypothetical protein